LGQDIRVPVLRTADSFNKPIIVPCLGSDGKTRAKPFGVKVLAKDILISHMDQEKIQVHRYIPSENGESNGGNRYLTNGAKYCRGIDVLSTEEIVLINNQEHKFMVIGKDGKISPYGSQGSMNDQFNFPRGVVVLPGDDIAICDTNNSRVQIFSKDGVHKKTIGNSNPKPEDNLLYCLGVAYNPNKKELAVSDADHNLVRFYDLDGKSLGNIGNSKEIQLKKPSGVAYDLEGNLYVAELDGNQIQMFDPQRKLIKEIGSNELRGPRMLTVAWDGSLVVADLENQRVLVY